MDFLVEFLQKNRSATYAEVRAAAETKKIEVYPIMYGRAQTLVGIVKAKPRGQGKTAMAAAEQRNPVRAPKAAPVSAPATASFDTSSLEGIIAAVKSSEQTKARYRSALEKIQSILGAALS